MGMKIVLSEAENKTMHASKLADKIFERRLYLQKNGNKAQYTKIRARCGHYPDMFEALPGIPMFKKRLFVSQKRQITIPIGFYNRLGIEKEVECYVQNKVLVIRPVRVSSGEFDEQILADLITQGLSGQELLSNLRHSRQEGW